VEGLGGTMSNKELQDAIDALFNSGYSQAYKHILDELLKEQLRRAERDVTEKSDDL
jgi:hypothetical protein